MCTRYNYIVYDVINHYKFQLEKGKLSGTTGSIKIIAVLILL